MTFGIYLVIMFFKGGRDMLEQLKVIIAEELGVDTNDITLESHIINDLGADSLDVVELIMALEDAFEIEVSDSDAQSLKTVSDVIKYIEKLK